MRPYYGEEGCSDEITGTIERLVIGGTGSIFQHESFVVVINNQQYVRLDIMEDGSFLQSSLEGFLSRHVKITGVWEFGVLCCHFKEISLKVDLPSQQPATTLGQKDDISQNSSNQQHSNEQNQDSETKS